MLALNACGGRAKAPPDGEPIQPSDAGPSAEPPSTAQPTTPEAPDGGSLGPQRPPRDTEPTAAEEAYSAWLATDVSALGVSEILAIYCGECHSNGDNGAAFASGLALDGLVAYGLIVPGASDESPLVQRIVDGSMPPGSGPSPTAGDVALLASFINTLSAPPPPCSSGGFVDLDGSLAVILADAKSRPAEDRPYLRYLTIAETDEPLSCYPFLTQQRRAIFKLVNSLSTSNEIHVPTAIDASELEYRIDIRDFGWARPIDVEDDGIVDHIDGWRAIVANATPYAVELTGPEASALIAETGTPVPVLSATTFVRAAAVGDVYYGLLGIRSSIHDTDLELGAEVIEEEKLAAMRRAVTIRRSPPNADVIVSRIPLAADGTRNMWRADMDDRTHSSSIFDDPLQIGRGDWTQTIIELPNGLHAYAVNGGDGARLYETAPGCIDDCGKPQARHAISCMGCHLSGVLPVDDLVRDSVVDQESLFPPDEFDLILEVYPPASQFGELVAASNARYEGALRQLGIRTDVRDPVSQAYLDFELPIGAQQAAAELGVSYSTLTAKAGALPATLAPVGTSTGLVERQVFTDAYVQALCAVHATSRNRPASCP